MTDIVVPTTIDPLPPPPLPSDTPAQFDARAFASLDAQVAMVEQVNESNAKTYQNAIATNERAVAANASAISAAGSASAAAGDANRLATLDALWLGESATDPTTGRDGAPLVAGNAYVNTSTGALRAYTGSAWVQGVHGAAGVASLNGEAGALIKTTLAAYGITDIATGALGNADLNTAITAGVYSFGAPVNGPGFNNGTLIVARHGALAHQTAVDATGSMFVRAATGIGSSPTWSAWRRVALHNDVAVALAGGAIDCSKGNRFTETVSANRTLAFTNIPASGAYACVLEINHTGGAITLPAGSVLSNGSPLSLVAGKRHLLYFERAQLGTAGWYVSTLPNYTP